MVVTLNPDPTLADRIAGLAAQVGAVVLVDNGSEGPLAWLELLAGTAGHLIRNRENLGIATALNQGLAWAAAHGFEWALLLDQDSEPCAHMVRSLGDAFDAYPERGRLAVIGSGFVDSRTLRAHGPGAGAVAECVSVITSGSLVAVKVWARLGGFREDFFIDCVDHEYCLRARRQGFAVALAGEVLMRHTIGRATMHRVLSRTTGTSNHPAVRRYYMTRNLLVMAREYFTDEPRWMLGRLYAQAKSLCLLAAFERERRGKLRLVGLGAWHALRGRLGKLGAP
ncbi:MAG TPA: glycosyltransferase family 2 protein [Polyangia bacterium]